MFYLPEQLLKAANLMRNHAQLPTCPYQPSWIPRTLHPAPIASPLLTPTLFLFISNKSFPAATRSINRGNEATQDVHARPSFRSSSGDLVFLPIHTKVCSSRNLNQWYSHYINAVILSLQIGRNPNLSSLADLIPV